MQLKTSKNREYSVDWIDTVTAGGVYMQMVDSRSLAEIAEEFDGLEWLERYDENQGDKRFDGYNTLTMIRREAPDVVVLWMKEA